MYIVWYYDRTGPGSVADIVSHLPGVQAELKSKASAAAAEASAMLDSMPKRRTGASQVQVRKGDLDWYVTIGDPLGAVAGASISKRFGILRSVL